MTEQNWVKGLDPIPSRKFLGSRVSERKARLFACACCWRIKGLLEYEWQWVEIAEGYANGTRTPEELNNTLAEATDTVIASVRDPASTTKLAANADACSAAHAALEPFSPTYPDLASRLVANAVANEQSKTDQTMNAWSVAWRRERVVHARILRDIFPTAFNSARAIVPAPTVDPAWLTSTVRSLAAGIYAERAFDRMPILADALEEAGCDHADILTHCRGDGPHVRGCWVVDLLLGKE